MTRRVPRSTAIRFLTTKADSASKPTATTTPTSQHAAAASPTWWKRYVSDPAERYVTNLGRQRNLLWQAHLMEPEEMVPPGDDDAYECGELYLKARFWDVVAVAGFAAFWFTKNSELEAFYRHLDLKLATFLEEGKRTVKRAGLEESELILQVETTQATTCEEFSHPQPQMLPGSNCWDIV